jgi:hypothetical protein
MMIRIIKEISIMKKTFITLLVLFAVLITSNAFTNNKTLDGKLGTSYVSDPEKFGWQLNFAYLTELDPFFALGFEPGIFWANWDRKVGTQQVGGVPADLKADTNAYIVPVLADAQIRLPNLQSKLNVLPYVTFGLGYSFMMLKYSTPRYTNTSGDSVPAEDKTKFFSGLTWQLMLGMAYDPGMSSKIRFLAEVGYRYAKLKKGTLEIDMSGLVLNVGIRYPLGSTASTN